MKTPIFEIKNLIYANNKFNILSIKKFEIHRSACYLFNGNMASGKTLLLDILSKNKPSYKGDVFYEGKSLKKIRNSVYNSEVKYVKQDFKAPYFKTVENYLHSIISSNSSTVNTKKTVDEIVRAMDFKYIIHSKMRDLTPSQLRWVNLAAGIIAFPKVLLIDELELHLSLNNIKNIIKILYRKSNYEGITIIATTQNKDFFKNLSSVNININHGRITSVRSSVMKKYNKK